MVENMFHLVADKATALSERVEVLSRRSIRDKLLCYFSLLASKAGGSGFSLPFSLSALADYISADRSAMMRELKKMREEHLLAVDGRAVTLYAGIRRTAFGGSSLPAESLSLRDQSSGWSHNPFFLSPTASFLSAAKEKRKRNAAKNYVFGFPRAASHGFYLAYFRHANAVPWKFHLNVALSLLLFSLPLLP